MHTHHCDRPHCHHHEPPKVIHDERCQLRRDQRDEMRRRIERAHQLYHDPCATQCERDQAIEEAFRASQY